MVVTAECTRTCPKGQKCPQQYVILWDWWFKGSRVQFSSETPCIFIGYFMTMGKKKGLANTAVITNVEVVRLSNDTYGLSLCKYF